MENENVRLLQKVMEGLEKIDTLLGSFQRKLEDRDGVIKQKDERINELINKLEECNKGKSEALQSKIDFMERYNKDKDAWLEEKQELIKELQETKEKVKKLEKIRRNAQDNVMGAGFEQDKLRKELEEKTRELEAIKQRFESFARGGTGILFDFENVLNYLKESIKKATSQLRLVVPTIEFIEENGLRELIEALPSSCVVNIATSFDLDAHKDLINRWKEKGFRLTDYSEKNLVCVSANGGNLAIVHVEGDKFEGFYTNIDFLMKLLNQAIMHAFIKGKKL